MWPSTLNTFTKLKTKTHQNKAQYIASILSRKIWRYQSCKSKEDRQYNGQKKKYKLTNDDLQNNTQTSKGSATFPLKPWGELRHSRRVSSSCSTSDTCCVTVVTNPVIIWYVTNRIVITTNGTYTSSCVTQILPKG